MGRRSAISCRLSAVSFQGCDGSGESAEAPARAAVAGFSFTADTFAFPNEIRARHPDRDDLYANYCFVLARGLRQFFAFARFDADAPRLAGDAYVERVRAIATRTPWHPPSRLRCARTPRRSSARCRPGS